MTVLLDGNVLIAITMAATATDSFAGLQAYVSSGSTVTPVTLRASDFSARSATGP